MINSKSISDFSEQRISGNNGAVATAGVDVAPTRRTMMNMMVNTAILATAISIDGRAALAAPRDPILALIENHKRIAKEYDQTVTNLDENDPARKELLDALGDAEADAAVALINETPTTLQGVLAILSYSVEWTAKGNRWPDNLLDDKALASEKAGKRPLGKSWEHFLHHNLIETMQTIAA